MTDYVYCNTCKEVFSQQKVLPRLGHSYYYKDNGNGTHTGNCTRCNKTTTAKHTIMENGACLCGYTDAVTDQSLKINHTLNLASDISINYAISTTLLEVYDMDSLSLRVRMPVYEGNSLTGEQVVALSPVEKGSYYYFTLEGLTAIRINDELYATVYGTKEGQTYCSPVDVYSVAAYAYAQMNHAARPDSLKVLCADLLRYGAKAQIFKGYRTDALADAAMTQAHRAYLSDIEAVTFGNTNVTLNDLANAPITWAGKALNLESKVEMKFVFAPGSYENRIGDLSLRVSYKDIEGQSKTATVKGAELYNASRGLYAFTFDGLLAAELRTVVSVQIFAGATPLSCTLQYSADTYGNNRTGDLLTLCKALFAYSDSAKAYFAS
jgi:hypothetical protein